jgi:hypothetical protein
MNKGTRTRRRAPGATLAPYQRSRRLWPARSGGRGRAGWICSDLLEKANPHHPGARPGQPNARHTANLSEAREGLTGHRPKARPSDRSMRSPQAGIFLICPVQSHY